MASPELSSPVLEAIRTSLFQAPSPLPLPPPTATSRGFLYKPIPRPDAKMKKVGFLHLPDNVRYQIYELAIYDHDRGAVFLPRGLPRKVLPDVDDVDIDCVEDEPGASEADDVKNTGALYKPVVCTPTGNSAYESAASGRWLAGENMQEATFLSLGLTLAAVKSMTDGQIIKAIENSDSTGHYSTYPLAPTSTLSDDEASAAKSVSDSDDESAITSVSCMDRTKPGWELRTCKCHFPSLPPDFCDSDHVEEFEESDDDRSETSKLVDEILAWSDESDSECECGAAECKVCCEMPVHFEDNDDAEHNVFAMDEDCENDDHEHYDTPELFGMVYEPKEPGLLLACQEIRQQALPLYYRRNSFSWRFMWTDYLQSCLRFKNWLKSISTDDIGLIGLITFQGRHAIEEGVEFSIDIDLLEKYPFFETRVYAEEDADIADAINRDMASYLWLMVQSVRKRPSFSVGHLCELANIFVQGMHRDAGGCTSDEASAVRRILSPLF